VHRQKLSVKVLQKIEIGCVIILSQRIVKSGIIAGFLIA
jgi:hypothetical protein